MGIGERKLPDSLREVRRVCVCGRDREEEKKPLSLCEAPLYMLFIALIFFSEAQASLRNSSSRTTEKKAFQVLLAPEPAALLHGWEGTSNTPLL